MTAKSITTTDTVSENKETIVNTLPETPIATPSEEAIDLNKVAALRAKAQAKQMEKKIVTAPKTETKKERSIAFGIIGSGQAGGRLAACYAKLGYEAVAINTAQQDLKYLDLPDVDKLHLEYGNGGAAKDLAIGAMAAETHKDEIISFISEKLEASQVNILALSLGGGSGAGSCETMVNVLTEIGKPLVVMTVLPMDSEDAQTKKNALETLSKLAAMTRSKKIANLIVVDNAKLEALYQNVSQVDFFETANKAIVNTVDIFNTLSCLPSSVKPLDSMEFSKIFLDGEGLTVYGELSISDFKDDIAIASAVVESLDSNLLASGFDLTKAKYVGIIFVANQEVWRAIPSSSVSYALSIINDKCSSPSGVFKGIYTVDSTENVVKIYSMFSGLALPDDRVEQLKKETKELNQNTKNKEDQRNLSLKLDTGTETNISAAQKVKDKIAAKSSAFGKFVNTVSDRRK